MAEPQPFGPGIGTRVRETVVNLSLIGTVGVAVATVTGFLGGVSYLFDLTSHFRVQYLVLAILCAVALGLARRWRWAALAACIAVVNYIPIAPIWWSVPAPAQPGAATLELVTFNVQGTNPEHEQVARYLVAAEADVIVLQEVTPKFARVLVDALPGYHSVVKPRQDSRGIAVYSRAPLVDSEVFDLAGVDVPAIAVSLVHGGRHYSLLAVHTIPPVGSRNAAYRDAMLADVAAWARDQQGHVIVAGDLNATPWSHAFRSLLADTDLVNSQLGFGVQPTWPSGLSPMRIPIDHLLHSIGLTTSSRRTGPFLGSDHRPLHVTLSRRQTSRRNK